MRQNESKSGAISSAMNPIDLPSSPKKKVLIASAIWGADYCEIFARYSLATMLAEDNIPKLSKLATITFHVVTTKRDHVRLFKDPAFVELAQFCAIEWEFIEDFGVLWPPTGEGGAKYSFLSALQNIAIRRSLDHNVIVFNYADFIWTNGSLTESVALLGDEGKIDAVLAFCLPVDRDSALPELKKFQKNDNDNNVIELSPRAGQRLALELMHREAQNRYWDSPRFTQTPSYLIWKAEDYGAVVRAYHQSILAMRVRADDAEYRNGILKGSLDAGLTAQLSKGAQVVIASDTDRVFAFSLYHTPVDSRMLAGMTRKTSLRDLLRGDVVPEQRRFSEAAFLLRRHDGGEAVWARTIEESANILRQAQDEAAFDQAFYDRNLLTHGRVPQLVRLTPLQRLVFRPAVAFLKWTKIIEVTAVLSPIKKRYVSRAWRVYERLYSPIRGKVQYHVKRAKRVCYVLWQPQLLSDAIERRRARLTQFRSALADPKSYGRYAKRSWARAVAFVALLKRFATSSLKRAKQAAMRPLAGFSPVRNVWVPVRAQELLGRAIGVEGSMGRMRDRAQLTASLKLGENSLREALRIAPLWIDVARALGRNLWFQGRFGEAMEAWSEAEKLRDELARQAGMPVDASVVLPRNCAQVIGLMGHLDGFVKRKILTGDPRPYYLLAPRTDIVNSAFLDYWKDYIQVVVEPSEIAALTTEEAVYGVNWNWMMPLGDRLAFVHAGLAATERAWQADGRAPLLKLKPAHVELLRAIREKWGIEDTDRFVCLHVRSEGFYANSDENSQRFRNTSIEAYYPLIRALTGMGIWVVRMGDPAMPALDTARCGNWDLIIDYALSRDRTPDLDVALSAGCELFISGPSGLLTVANAFGTPVCEVNYPIYSGFPWNPKHIFVPQMYFSHAKGRALSVDEILGSDAIYRDHQFLLDQAGISLIPNEPDDIIETVREALAPATYGVSDPALADRVCAAFQAANEKFNAGISGKLGRYFAMKYAAQLLPEGPLADDVASVTLAPALRKLDFLIPCFNRVRYLHHILETGLALNLPGVYFVVIDDHSHAFEEVPGLGLVNTETVCRSFGDERVIYSRNPSNMGVANSLERYYREVCQAEYTSLLNPKDEFINSVPVVNALAKLDADPTMSMVLYPLRQIDRNESDKPLLFEYPRMTGSEFIAAHVRDSNLQHAGAYAIIRVSALRKAGVPRSLHLREMGLEDASGIDHEMLFNMATTGDVDFVGDAPIRRQIVGGYTEAYPLTFAYTQYQYARRLMAELEPRGFVSAETRRLYLGFWHLIITRGLVVSYQHVHGSEQEEGVKRIRPHLPMPILLYLPAEALRWGVWPSRETVSTYLVGAKLVLKDWLRKVRGLPHVA